VATVLYLNATSTVFNKKIKNMDNLLTTEEKSGVKPYLFELLDQKKEEGRAEGIEKGRKEGIEKGREEGIEKGREEGMEKGREEGMENTIRLFLIKNPNWTDQQVAECFEVTIEFVGKIRKK
jgi:flagellar biosynthesis/type III secretory pathway protein FliH